MTQFIIGVVILIVGYFVYGKIVEDKFAPDENIVTPAIRLEDGVDYVPMSKYRLFLIQLLNIAGLGPIFGAIQGALFGPVAFVWIAIGCIFAGGVHDYFSAMLSVRHDGKSFSEITGEYLGEGMRKVMRVFSVILLVLIGTVFLSGPAGLLTGLELFGLTNFNVWLVIIFIYYFLATILPVDKIIGKLYPLFGISFIVMAVGIGFNLIKGGYTLPEFTLQSLHPQKLPVWAMLFTTITCGAISGFHVTQSPLVARCLENEKDGREVFYGAMIAEGIIAMVWAAAAMAFFGNVEGLGEFYYSAVGGPGGVVNHISLALMGTFGGLLAMIGVIVAPITSGDTAFRSARLTIADAFNIKQDKTSSRLLLAAPLFVISFLLTRIDFDIVWRYFAWANQTLAMIALWTVSAYLVRVKKSHWMSTIPAVFMSAVSGTYLIQAPEGFGLGPEFAYPIGIIFAVICFTLFMMKAKRDQPIIE